MPGAASAPSMMPEHVCRCCQTPAEGKTPVTENRSLRARARGHTQGRGGPGCQDCGELGTLSRVEGPVLPDPISTPLCFQKNLKPGSECELILILKTGLDRANLAGGPCPPHPPHTSPIPQSREDPRLPASCLLVSRSQARGSLGEAILLLFLGIFQYYPKSSETL